MNREDLLKELQKKRYTKFLKDLNVAQEKHLKILLKKIDELNDKFVFLNGNLYYINYKTAQLSEKLTKKDFAVLIDFELGALSSFFNVDYYYTFLKIIRVFNNVSFRIDPFASKKQIKINKEKKEIVIIDNKIYINKPKKLISYTKEEQEEIMKDYIEHFQNKLNDFLDFIVYTRFTQNRKKSFLNLNAKSNWGKGFLMGIFAEKDFLDTAAIVDTNDLKEDRAVGLQPQQIQNSLVLFLDEFKKFSNHLFKITHSINIEPKFSFKQNVELFAKIMLNADKSESFNYLVDEQIANRVIIIEIKNNKKLDDRPLYLKNTLKYKQVVADFIYNYITEKINSLIKMGREKATLKAEEELRKIYNKYSIKNNFDINETIKETIYSFILKVIKENERLTKKEQDIAANLYIQDNVIYITKTISTLMQILENELDKAEFSKVKFKKGMLLDIFNKQQKTYRILCLPKKAIAISLEEIEEYLGNIRVEKKEFKDIDDFLMKLRHYTYDIPPSAVKYLDEDVIEFYDVIDNIDNINEQLQRYNYDEEKFLKDYAERVEQAKKEYEIKKNFEEAIKTAEEEKELIGFLTADELEKEYELLEKEESPF